MAATIKNPIMDNGYTANRACGHSNANSHNTIRHRTVMSLSASANKTHPDEGLLFVISAASGTGKTTLIQALLDEDPGLGVSVSHTTRPMRQNERDGVNYHFVSKKDFQALIAQEAFIEFAEVFGNFYGTSLSSLHKRLSDGEDMLLEIDWQGALQVRKAMSHAVMIFILPPSMAALEARLQARGQDQPEVIHRRLAGATEEISHCHEFDYLVVNSDFKIAKAELSAIIQVQRMRTDRRRQQLEKLLTSALPPAPASKG